MECRPETSLFLRELEEHRGRKLRFPREVGLLIDLARQAELIDLFEDATFHAKFVTRAYGIMERIGVEGEGYVKLAAEFQAGIEKASTLLKTVVKESPADLKEHFVRNFFSLNQESLSQLMGLLGDLAAVKNWRLDGKPLP